MAPTPFSSLISFHPTCPFLYWCHFVFLFLVLKAFTRLPPAGLVSFAALVQIIIFRLKEAPRLPVVGSGSDTHGPLCPVTLHNCCSAGYFSGRPMGKSSVPEPWWLYSCRLFFTIAKFLGKPHHRITWRLGFLPTLVLLVPSVAPQCQIYPVLTGLALASSASYSHCPLWASITLHVYFYNYIYHLVLWLPLIYCPPYQQGLPLYSTVPGIYQVH